MYIIYLTYIGIRYAFKYMKYFIGENQTSEKNLIKI